MLFVYRVSYYFLKNKFYLTFFKLKNIELFLKQTLTNPYTRKNLIETIFK